MVSVKVKEGNIHSLNKYLLSIYLFQVLGYVLGL